MHCPFPMCHTSFAYTDTFPFLFVVAKMVWNSSQVLLVLMLPDDTVSVNKRNMMHFQLVATCAYKHIISIYSFYRSYHVV